MIKELWVKNQEKEARRLMRFGNEIWRKYNWKHGGMVDMEILKSELKHKIGRKKVSPINYYILEDANYHSENQALEESGLFGKNFKYGKSGIIKYNKYRKLKGRTWQL